MIPKSYFIIAANLLKNPCRIIMPTNLNTKNYKHIVNIWKRYRFFNKSDFALCLIFLYG